MSVVIFQQNPTGEESFFEQAVHGAAYVDAAFADNTLTGKATNLYNDDTQATTAGSLTFSNCEIDRSGEENALTVEATVEITFDDGVVGVDK